MSLYLFDKTVLDPLVEQIEFKDNLKIRPLMIDDFDKGYLSLLAQLTTVGDVSADAFQKQFKRMRSTECYYVTVIEDTVTERVIGTATLFIEHKFIHNAGTRGRVEDVVIDSEYRGQRLGNILIETLKKMAQYLNCYKLTLDCKDEMISWYAKFGFKAELGRANMLTIRLNKS